MGNKQWGSKRNTNFNSNILVDINMFFQSQVKYYKNIIEKSVAGTYNFTTSKSGVYEIQLVGGGGGSGSFDAKYYGGWSRWTFACGGSGAYFYGLIRLDANTTYSLTVGAGGALTRPNGTSGAGGNTYISKGDNILISAGGGSGAQCAYYLGESVTGQGGTLTLGDSVIETYKALNGRNGPYGINKVYQYAASVYDNSNTGYGASGYGWGDGDDHAGSSAGVAGYAKILGYYDSFPATANDYDFKISKSKIFVPVKKENSIIKPYLLLKK